MTKDSQTVTDWNTLLQAVRLADPRMLGRAISLVENEVYGYRSLLEALPARDHPPGIIGITGPPGAGKSTLTDALIGGFVAQAKKVAVVCVDPSSPFHRGAVLGDRIRMSDWYNHPSVFIRSLATRGALGGLHPKIIEVTDLLGAAGFDMIIVETVGVGQSEVEIASLADTTVVVLVPEAGDEIQSMKAGLMEIADVFVVNKADRPDADRFVTQLRAVVTHGENGELLHIPIVKTIATEKQGITELALLINQSLQAAQGQEKKMVLLLERAYQLILSKKTKQISREDLARKLRTEATAADFNLYRFVAGYD